MPRILLYSDEPVSIRGFESVLRDIDGFEALPPCNTVEEVLERLADKPDVLVLDLTGDVTYAVLVQMKAAMMTTKIVLWVSAISTEIAFQAMGMGVRGILRKTLPVELQVKCLQKVMDGELWFEKAMTDRFLCSRRVAVTQREGQLISLVAQGLSNKEIANTLLITEGTVKTYLSKLFTKIGAANRWELALFGLKNLTSGHEVHMNGKPPSAIGLRSLVVDRPLKRPEDPELIRLAQASRVY